MFLFASDGALRPNMVLDTVRFESALSSGMKHVVQARSVALCHHGV